MEPQIVIQDWEGRHNASEYVKRLEQSRAYEDLSTVIITPTRGQIPAKVVQNWLGLMKPMNQKSMHMMIIGAEVGKAYTDAVEMIRAHPELSTWKYALTLEEDNLVPPDGLLKLLEGIKDYDAVGGLYWTKGEGGMPMCYGNPAVAPKNFIPQIPAPDALTPCNGLGMGFTLFRMGLLLSEKLPKPVFETVQRFTPEKGGEGYTQDLKFFENAGREGFRFACDSRVKVGHFDYAADVVW